MNLPNKLTVLRVVLIPFFVAALMIDKLPGNVWLAIFFFAAASITDWFDGRIAREQNLVTSFGKFLDPLADKMLVMSALVCFTALGWCDPAAVIIILAREFMVSGLRLVTAKEGVVAAAGMWGKVKTAFTMVAVIGMMALDIFFGPSGMITVLDHGVVFAINEVLIWIATVLTVISGGIYLKQYWQYIDPSK
ncbi:CDP-diacylglycerol--glycerol-3-phosphate 3-phosphatidyltransferase [Ruminococcus sp. YE71]|uniref:CDP-diacylglycerol--glycerol-3-phosphate 3-phosphatidyltransferase n=1 Tax=unclassified Ruminococcus TaxID=2608920 RepID=UPI00088E8ED4|nr:MULTISPECIES: CDP-diacylglycerol--glycerol-3-phosphate 3-phosphatidyltransferase [unclassified Ruminococcus]SDA09489.1 CDP-diacylglycerol--glycerol-3-phosphate 3-phosphatidyltransferase [Ruminococcus sp. YE78]SFW12162.1 CDP-diacylglycerol--glycerol-3-phosphate 3-phosphatidyltransferase [Ruminococcus sp. YE71]